MKGNAEIFAGTSAPNIDLAPYDDNEEIKYIRLPEDHVLCARCRCEYPFENAYPIVGPTAVDVIKVSSGSGKVKKYQEKKVKTPKMRNLGDKVDTAKVKAGKEKSGSFVSSSITGVVLIAEANFKWDGETVILPHFHESCQEIDWVCPGETIPTGEEWDCPSNSDLPYPPERPLLFVDGTGIGLTATASTKVKKIKEMKPTKEPKVKDTKEPEVTPTKEPKVKDTKEPEVTPTKEPKVKVAEVEAAKVPKDEDVKEPKTKEAESVVVQPSVLVPTLDNSPRKKAYLPDDHQMCAMECRCPYPHEIEAADVFVTTSTKEKKIKEKNLRNLGSGSKIIVGGRNRRKLSGSSSSGAISSALATEFYEPLKVDNTGMVVLSPFHPMCQTVTWVCDGAEKEVMEADSSMELFQCPKGSARFASRYSVTTTTSVQSGKIKEEKVKTAKDNTVAEADAKVKVKAAEEKTTKAPNEKKTKAQTVSFIKTHYAVYSECVNGAFIPEGTASIAGSCSAQELDVGGNEQCSQGGFGPSNLQILESTGDTVTFFLKHRFCNQGLKNSFNMVRQHKPTRTETTWTSVGRTTRQVATFCATKMFMLNRSRPSALMDGLRSASSEEV